MKNEPKIILASKSPSRAMILKNAGIAFEIIPSRFNEAVIKKDAKANNAKPESLATTLAKKKAVLVSKERPEAFVIGADQILEFNGRIFDKPKSIDDAVLTLRELRGKTHRLISCVAIAKKGEIVFEDQDEAKLTMWAFPDLFLEDYVERAGEKILTSVGAYQLEGEGATLFEKIEGDFFTILGLPLLPLLGFLRRQAAFD